MTDPQHTRPTHCDWRCRERYEKAHKLGRCPGDPSREHRCLVAHLRPGAEHPAPTLCGFRFLNCNEARLPGTHFCQRHTRGRQTGAPATG